jgi:hypothetical protein
MVERPRPRRVRPRRTSRGSQEALAKPGVDNLSAPAPPGRLPEGRRGAEVRTNEPPELRACWTAIADLVADGAPGPPDVRRSCDGSAATGRRARRLTPPGVSLVAHAVRMVGVDRLLAVDGGGSGDGACEATIRRSSSSSSTLPLSFATAAVAASGAAWLNPISSERSSSSIDVSSRTSADRSSSAEWTCSSADRISSSGRTAAPYRVGRRTSRPDSVSRMRFGGGGPSAASARAGDATRRTPRWPVEAKSVGSVSCGMRV